MKIFWTILTLLQAFDFCLAKMFTSRWVIWLCLSTFSLSICRSLSPWSRLTFPIRLKPCWGLFPTNENHFPIFAHIRKLWKRALRDLLAWISRETNLFKMAFQAKKLSVMKIRKIFCVGKSIERGSCTWKSLWWVGRSLQGLSGFL